MAFRGETSGVMVADVQVGSSETVAAKVDRVAIAPADALRVKVALGLMIVVALIDCVLYLPRVF